MKFGLCASHTQSAAALAAGFDFIEENAQRALQPAVAEDEWTGERDLATSALAVPSANALVPGDLPITGPGADPAALGRYMQTLLPRAAAVGMRTLVFGSAGARNVPAGFDPQTARGQIVAFLKAAAPLAEREGVTLVIEPLNRGESNIINTLAEAMEYVRAVDTPAVAALLDTYHFWLEAEPLEHLQQAVAAGAIRHVHLADPAGRVAPGQSGQADYRPIFVILKSAGYGGLISVECSPIQPFDPTASRVVAFLHAQWREA